MLVLSRKLGEQIIIGNDIVITVLDIRSDKVRVGIHAPANVPIMRQELLTTKKDEEPLDASELRW